MASAESAGERIHCAQCQNRLKVPGSPRSRKSTSSGRSSSANRSSSERPSVSTSSPETARQTPASQPAARDKTANQTPSSRQTEKPRSTSQANDSSAGSSSQTRAPRQPDRESQTAARAELPPEGSFDFLLDSFDEIETPIDAVVDESLDAIIAEGDPTDLSDIDDSPLIAEEVEIVDLQKPAIPFANELPGIVTELDQIDEFGLTPLGGKADLFSGAAEADTSSPVPEEASAEEHDPSIPTTSFSMHCPGCESKLWVEPAQIGSSIVCTDCFTRVKVAVPESKSMRLLTDRNKKSDHQTRGGEDQFRGYAESQNKPAARKRPPAESDEDELMQLIDLPDEDAHRD